MEIVLIRSEYITIRSDGYSDPIRNKPPRASPPTRARAAAARADLAWFADRDVQALRAAELPLCQRIGARPEAISGHQSAWRPASQRLRHERGSRAGCPFDRQFPQIAGGAQRDLRDQYRTSAPARGSRVGPDGSGPHRRRSRQGGCHHSRHGYLLSRCRRLTDRYGEGR